MKPINIIRVNTTAFKEEDFYLMTDLSENEIAKAITPIVLNERCCDKEYHNDDLYEALIRKYPKAFVMMRTEIDILSI
jgi:hypothetical protein